MSKNVFFKIIIPCYNSGGYITKCLQSIKSQTFTDYEVIIVNDQIEDDSFKEACEFTKNIPNMYAIDPGFKLWNGGARNYAMNILSDSEYTLFMDNDDWLDDEKCLEEIHRIISVYKYPDCVRLPYKCIMGNTEQLVPLAENTPKDLVNSLFIAPWTKCIKTDKLVEFPKNTLIEDVVQHIEQCDKIETVAVCRKPIICWNRNNTAACSLKENQNNQNSKRISSIYRNIADLMDLQCTHDYCEQHRLWRLQCYKNLVKEGKEETF